MFYSIMQFIINIFIEKVEITKDMRRSCEDSRIFFFEGGATLGDMIRDAFGSWIDWRGEKRKVESHKLIKAAAIESMALWPSFLLMLINRIKLFRLRFIGFEPFSTFSVSTLLPGKFSFRELLFIYFLFLIFKISLNIFSIVVF